MSLFCFLVYCINFHASGLLEVRALLAAGDFSFRTTAPDFFLSKGAVGTRCSALVVFIFLTDIYVISIRGPSRSFPGKPAPG